MHSTHGGLENLIDLMPRGLIVGRGERFDSEMVDIIPDTM